jgi:hypothetical protein
VYTDRCNIPLNHRKLTVLPLPSPPQRPSTPDTPATSHTDRRTPVHPTAGAIPSPILAPIPSVADITLGEQGIPARTVPPFIT